MINEPLFRNFTPLYQLIFLLLIILSSFLLTFLLGYLIAIPLFGPDVLPMLSGIGGTNGENNIEMMKYFQVVSQFGTFIIPAFVFAFIIKRDIWGYLKLTTPPQLKSIILSVVMIMAILPFINWLVSLNGMFHLPESLSGLEQWMRSSEQQAMELTEAFLSDTTWKGLVINLVMFAVLAAVGEELIFRGVLLRILYDWSKNRHLAVWLSAILFSALHLQFFGFLPRMILGVVLGYLFLWSKSLWLPIVTHLINNAAAVIAAFFYFKGDIDTDMESFGSSASPVTIVASFLIVVGLMYTVYSYEKKSGNVV
ncbi:MAG: CPBP family intramembrane metalloprotease [Bacteroidales bacterium]|nr:CPBP family intramembrane metalloprotease [Bacteroidales bacterium]